MGSQQSSIPRLKLSATQEIPALGFGLGTAWYNSPDERKTALQASVQAALSAGFTHIDEAEAYKNEDVTGVALKEWLAQHPETPRSALHVTSKVMSVDAGIESICRRSLDALGVEYCTCPKRTHSPVEDSPRSPVPTLLFSPCALDASQSTCTSSTRRSSPRTRPERRSTHRWPRPGSKWKASWTWASPGPVRRLARARRAFGPKRCPSAAPQRAIV